MDQNEFSNQFTNTLNKQSASAPPPPELNIDHDWAPPPYSPVERVYPQLTNTIKPFNGTLTTDQAKDALVRKLSESIFSTTKAAKALEITNIECSFSYLLHLKTFTEKRTTCWESNAYKGEHVDFGVTPNHQINIWSIQSPKEPNLFENKKCSLKIPHTEYLAPCIKCHGTGRKRCDSCNGQGSTACKMCCNTGKNRDGQMCGICNGRGRKLCNFCDSTGSKYCYTCMNSGQIKYFQTLKISWKNHEDEYVPEPNFIPVEKLKKVTGDIIFEDEATRVYPLNNSLPEINKASQNLIEKHAKDYLAKEHALRQRQTLKVIQVATVSYLYNGKIGTYWIYGKELQVHCPELPKFSCSIM